MVKFCIHKMREKISFYWMDKYIFVIKLSLKLALRRNKWYTKLDKSNFFPIKIGHVLYEYRKE